MRLAAFGNSWAGDDFRVLGSVRRHGRHGRGTPARATVPVFVCHGRGAVRRLRRTGNDRPGLDAIFVRTVPGVHKAVKWNTPFYGIKGESWFLGFHCLTKYVKVAFFRGTTLRSAPPGESKQSEAQYLDIHENDPFDEAQVADWVKQASQLPGAQL
jgi:hypothetical protein